MKFLFALLLAIFVPLACPAQDYEKEGALSANLKLAIAYQPKGDNDTENFQITLTNVSEKNLVVEVADKVYCGSIFIALKGEKPVEFYEQDIRRRRLVGILPGGGIVKLAKDGTIVWKIPVADLRDVGGASVKAEALHEASVHAVLNPVAIIPPKGGSSIESNARQTSPSILVSKR